MKGFLLFCVVLSGIVFIGLALPYLDGRDREYERRFVGALKYAESTLEAALGSSADIYQPAIAPGPTPGRWTLSGTVVSRSESNGKTGVPFVANLRSLCSNPAAFACWRTVELAIDGRVMRSESAADAPVNAPTEAIAETTVGPDETDDKPAVPAAVRLADEAAAAAASPADEVMPAAAEGPIEAAASVENAPTPGDSAEETVSGQELVLFIQDALKKLRYEPGPIDGKLGARTAAAIRDYQRDFDLPQDGRPSPALLRHMRGQLSDLGQQSRSPAGSGALVAG